MGGCVITNVRIFDGTGREVMGRPGELGVGRPGALHQAP